MSEKKKMASRIVFHAERAEKTAKERDIADYLVFNSVSMDCFQAVNYAISLGEKLIEERDLEPPYSYREIFDVLRKNGLISGEIRNAMARLVYLRNVVAHQYGDVNDVDIKEAVSLLRHVKKFAEAFI